MSALNYTASLRPAADVSWDTGWRWKDGTFRAGCPETRGHVNRGALTRDVEQWGRQMDAASVLTVLIVSDNQSHQQQCCSNDSDLFQHIVTMYKDTEERASHIFWFFYGGLCVLVNMHATSWACVHLSWHLVWFWWTFVSTKFSKNIWILWAGGVSHTYSSIFPAVWLLAKQFWWSTFGR